MRAAMQFTCMLLSELLQQVNVKAIYLNYLSFDSAKQSFLSHFVSTEGTELWVDVVLSTTVFRFESAVAAWALFHFKLLPGGHNPNPNATMSVK